MARGDHAAAVSAATCSPRAGQWVTACQAAGTGLQPSQQSERRPHPQALSAWDAPALSHHGTETGVTAGAEQAHAIIAPGAELALH